MVEALTQSEIEAEIRGQIFKCLSDPLRHAEIAYPWGHGILEGKTLRDWQRDVLAMIRDHISNPSTRFDVLQIAIASGHGIGKSALISMIIKWALDTCDNARVVCTANTESQLRTKTVPEVTKWSKMAITSHWFNTTATAIYSSEKEYERSWRCDFIPWSANNTESFAGLHNQGKRVVVLMDEASSIDDNVWEVVEGALTDEGTELIFIAFGNPTRNQGRFRECFRKFSKYWKTRHIDSRTVEGTNKQYLDRIVEQYGEDSDQARIRVKGQFPNASAYQLFGTSDVERAQGKHLEKHQYDFAPKIIAVDPAWTGGDDFVISMRQGLMFKCLEVHPKNDNDIQMANRIARLEDEYDADAVFVDMGYGTGIVSAGQTMGRSWRLVNFGEKSLKKDCFNKRAEMYVSVRDWLKEGGSFETDQELFDEMIATETVPTMDGKYKLPPKEDMKETLGRSPNKLDALAISFAYPVAPRRVRDDLGLPLEGYPQHQNEDYDPLENL